ncbi:MAG: hypothetical protein LC768_01130 [Acidobacteria bacterium]|nr:hypothetical protein [Acidobacteriota bacterium]MCA1636936.1 hypothetical protein [Acidobacteriota bacterium]
MKTKETKMKTTIDFTRFATVVFLTLMCGAIFFAAVSFVKANPDSSLSKETKQELARARQATARYHNINNAIADGYFDINVFFPNMGYHYLKRDILDAEFDPAKPELLVYADFGNGHPRLVALEYAVPLALSQNPPEGFTGDDDHWHRNETFGLWTLHAWIWYPNPDGMFAAYNPRVPE